MGVCAGGADSLFPDEHLGRNTGNHKGIQSDQMVVWDPFKPMGGNSEEALRNAKVILWKGYCSVHARFSVDQIAKSREAFPDVQVIVHPECREEVVNASDAFGSTEHIIDVIGAPVGKDLGVGEWRSTWSIAAKRDAGEDDLLFWDPVICPC